MKDVFLTVMRLCLSASIVLAVVVLLRFVLKKLNAPKALSCALWALVALRLLIPVFPSARVSLVPQPVGSGQVVEEVAARTVEPTRVVREEEPVYQEIVRRSPEIPVRREATGERYVVVSRETLAAPKTVRTDVVPILARVWAGGAVLMLGYMLYSYLRVRCRVRASLQMENNVYRCDTLESPFILGLFRPRIYLPSEMDAADEVFVLAHERAHIRRLDHIWKPLGFLLLAVYWFNPLFWLGYVLLCRDIESACDEKVVREQSADYRKAYSLALVNCSAPRRMISACPLAFGETGVKGRIRAVLNYKKPAFWMLTAALIIGIVTAGCALTNGKESTGAPTEPSETVSPTTEPPETIAPASEAEMPTGYPSGEIQMPFLFHDGALYYCDGRHRTDKPDPEWKPAGTVTAEDNIKLPEEEGTAARIAAGTPLFRKDGEDIIWYQWTEYYYGLVPYREDPSAQEFPYDCLGVMSGKTNLGPHAAEGEIISREEYTAASGENEVKLAYLSTDRKITGYYRFVFKEKRTDSTEKRAVDIRVILNNLGGSGQPWQSGGMQNYEDWVYLYDMIACRAYRPLTENEARDLPGAPLAWFDLYDSENDTRGIFALTEDGYLVHAPGNGDPEWFENDPWDWNERSAAWDAVTREPLPEAVRLHLAAIGIRYLDQQELVPFPLPADTVLQPEEFWRVKLEADGKEKTLTGRDVRLLEQIFSGNRLEASWYEDSVLHTGALPAACGKAVKITVTDGRQETGPAGPQLSVYLTEEGKLIMERAAWKVSPLGVEDGFAVRACFWAESLRTLEQERYQTLLSAVVNGDPVEFEEQVISAVSVPDRFEAAAWAGVSWQIPRDDPTGQWGRLYENGGTIADFLVIPPGGLVTEPELYLLDSANKQLIQCGLRDGAAVRRQVIPQAFLDEPRLLCPGWQNGELFILDRGGVNAVFPDDAAVGHNYRPLPDGISGDDVEDMILTRTADGPELVLITRRYGNYGMTPQTEAELETGERESGFIPTESGYHVSETEQGLLIRVNEVTWKLPRFPERMQILSVSPSRLAVGLIDEAAGDAKLRCYANYPDGLRLFVSRVDLSDWETLPGRFWRDSYLIAPRAETMDVYQNLYPGEWNVIRPGDDPLQAAFVREAGDAPEVSAEELAVLQEYIGDHQIRRFLMTEYDGPEQADLSVIQGSGLALPWQEIPQEERTAALLAMGLDVRYADRDWQKILRADLDAVLQQALGLSLEDMEKDPPGVYLAEYDAFYLLPDQSSCPYMILRAARRLSDGTVLAAWESQYQDAGGLVRLVQTENGWHIFSNRIIYEQLSGYFGG